MGASPIIPVESRNAHVGRLRRLAQQTAAKGMRCSVSGEEIRGVLAALDEAVDRADQAEAALVARPKGKTTKGDAPDRSFDDDDVVSAMNAAAEIMRARPEMWGQPLSVALKAYCADLGQEVPDSWARMITP